MPKKRPRVCAKTPRHTPLRNESAISAAICLCLVATVCAVFGQTLGHAFLNYDDDEYVYANPNITRGLTATSLRWAFTHVHADNWHPLTTLSHMLDCQLYGLQPWGHHLTNVLLHAAAAVLLFLALRSLSGALWRSALAAALFAIHPLRAESVAWISERKDVLSGVFFMLTLWSYARYARGARKSIPKYLTTLVLFALGLLCKPTLVTLPFVLLLLDYWPLRRFSATGTEATSATPWRQLIIEKIPFFFLTAVSCVATILAQQKVFETSFAPTRAQCVGNAIVSYATYLGETIWPAHLAILYPYRPDEPGVGAVLLAFFLLSGLTCLGFVLRKSYPFLLVGWLWFLGMLVPMIGLVQVGLQSHADRYTYLPQIGLCIALAWGARELSVRWRRGRTAAVVVVLFLVTTLGVCAYRETAHWQDSVALWSHAIENTSANAVAENSLGRALLEKGELSQAVSHFQEALKVEPLSVATHTNLGKAFEREGRTDEALFEFQRALDLNPDDPDAFFDLGNVAMDKGQIQEATSYYERALQLKPDFAGVYNNLAIAQLRLGELDAAIASYRHAVALRPDLPDPPYNLGNALTRNGNLDEAIASYETSLQLRPDSATVQNALSFALLEAGKTDEALEHLQLSLRLDPNKPETHFNLAHLMARLGRKDDAVTELTKVLRLRPGNTEAMRQLRELQGAK